MCVDKKWKKKTFVFTIKLSATNKIEQPNFWNFFRVNIRIVNNEPIKPNGNNIQGYIRWKCRLNLITESLDIFDDIEWR